MNFVGILVPDSLKPLAFPWEIADLDGLDFIKKRTGAKEFILTIVRVAACAATFIATARMGLTLKNCALSTAALSVFSEGAGSMLMGAFIGSYGISVAGAAIASKAILSKATLKAVAVLGAGYVKLNSRFGHVSKGIFETHIFDPVYRKIEPTIQKWFFPDEQNGVSRQGRSSEQSGSSGRSWNRFSKRS